MGVYFIVMSRVWYLEVLGEREEGRLFLRVLGVGWKLCLFLFFILTCCSLEFVVIL